MLLNLESLGVPLSLRASVTLTDEELMRFSAENQPYRIERNAAGEVLIMSPVGGIGSSNEGYVFGEFFLWNKQTGSGKSFGPSAGFHLPDGSVLSPDASWVAHSRWEALTKKEQTTFPPLCPDFLIEVRSASDSQRELEAKMLLWLGNGARLAWLIDPLEQTVIVYRQDYGPETLSRPSTVCATPPVEGFLLDCTPLWTA